MRQSNTPKTTPPRRGHPERESATTAAGLAAERLALAERQRRTSRARTAARRLGRRPTGSKP